MTYKEFINNLQQITLPKDFFYLPSFTSSEQSVYTLLSVSENEIKAKRDGTELSVSITQIHTIIDNLLEYIPLDVEGTLKGSGNTRSIIESLFCLLPNVFHTRISNRKHIVYIPTKLHDLGDLAFISESDLTSIISEHKNNMRQQIEKEYKDYLTNYAVSKRSGKRFTPSAISSYLLFTKCEKLFDYAPDKWNDIENIYDITSMDSISQIIRKLKNDQDFCKRNREDNNGWRLGAINQYFDFLVQKSNNKKADEEELMEPVIDEDNTEKDKIRISNFTTTPLYLRYIRSLLSKPFVILSGNSGTGKTRIATRFAKYLEKENDSGMSNHLLIPVGADWTDNTKVLGYYNPLFDNGAGKYEKTDVFKFIECANENPEIPFFLILDEMNLSHVERYFSDFLSKMELLDYSEKSEKVFFDIPGYGKLELPRNLFITGTVNIDETTYMFSPKVLDRANVIEFKPEMEDVLNNLLENPNSEDEKIADPGVAEDFMKLANEVHSGLILPEVQSILDGIKPILELFYKELKKYGFEFAYRTVKEIRLYTIAAYKTAEGIKPTATEIADIQILQKILPKIHGNKKQIGLLLNELEKLCIQKDISDSTMTPPVSGSGYALPLSLKKIRQMKDRLDRFQYASYIL